MRRLYILFLLLALLSSACKKGPAGDIGPVGAKGATGDAGANNSTVGPKGDTGPTGDRGLAGSKGETGPAGDAGVANLAISDWKKPVWKYKNTNGSSNYYIGEVDFPEITQSVIDKGFVITYLRINNTTSTVAIFPQGMSKTIISGTGNYELSNNGYKVGKAMILYVDNSGAPQSSIIGNLSALGTELRVSIIK